MNGLSTLFDCAVAWQQKSRWGQAASVTRFHSAQDGINDEQFRWAKSPKDFLHYLWREFTSL